ncbi:MAG: electron transfer flavoprotein subunit beta/FixA family protein [Candidatus Lokiarchaeota archaeon]|nr:electron transfer flavoprotein subunit beta/FixA family protein [Candidatus Lokiarchaeota archaeon]
MARALEMCVCIKQVPGTSEVDVDENGSLIRDNIDTKMNPFDLFAIETALRIKERIGGGFIRVISMGPPQAEEVIREAFTMGVDAGSLLTDRRFAGADVLATSYTLSQGIKKYPFDLVICGKQTTDGDTAQVGAEIAEFLGIPHVNNVKCVRDIKETSIIVEADLPDVIQVVEVSFPCLISVDKDIYQPRLPSYKRKIATKDRPVDKLTMMDLADKDTAHYGLKGSPTKVQRVFPPTSDTTRETWRGAPDELAGKMHAMLKNKKLI